MKNIRVTANMKYPHIKRHLPYDEDFSFNGVEVTREAGGHYSIGKRIKGYGGKLRRCFFVSESELPKIVFAMVLIDDIVSKKNYVFQRNNNAFVKRLMELVDSCPVYSCVMTSKDFFLMVFYTAEEYNEV